MQPPLAQAVPPAPARPVAVPLPRAADDYLLAHQGVSPRISFQGMAPYVRSVSDEARATRRTRRGGRAGARVQGRCRARSFSRPALPKRNRRRRSTGCARSTTRRRSSPTAAPSSTSTAGAPRLRASRAMRPGRHRAPRGARRRAARDRTHARHGEVLPAREPRGEGRPAHRRPHLPGAAARAHRRAGAPLRHRAGRRAAGRRDRLPDGGAAAQGQPALRLPALRRREDRHAPQGRHLRREGQRRGAVHVHPARDRRRDPRAGEDAAQGARTGASRTPRRRRRPWRAGASRPSCRDSTRSSS